MFNAYHRVLVSKLFRAYGLYNLAAPDITGNDKHVSKLFRAYGLYNKLRSSIYPLSIVSKLFRAYGLYNGVPVSVQIKEWEFQSSFELTGYITYRGLHIKEYDRSVSKLFRAYGLYNLKDILPMRL